MPKEFKQNPVTVRILKTYERLRAIGKIRSQRDLCDKMHWDYSSFNVCLKGARDFPAHIVPLFIKKFNVNEDYIYKGIAPMFPDDSDDQIKKDTVITETNSDPEIRILQTKLEAALKENELLRELLDVYKSKK